MKVSTSMLKVNGIWRSLLTVQSTEIITYTETEFKHTFTDGEGNEMSTTYYIDGLYGHREENGVHIYQFLYNGSYTEDGKKAEMAEALRVLGVEV